MAEGYVVAARGPQGEPTRITCGTHAKCGWFFPVVGKRRDDDPILKAQFAHHLREEKEPQLKILGHQRRQRV